jgi:hypothetical protein
MARETGAGLMIEINLLPQEMRKRPSPFANIDFSAFSLQKLPVMPIAAGFVGLLILVLALVFAMGLYSRMALSSLTKRYEAITPKMKEAQALMAQNDSVNKRVSAIDDLMSGRFSWAKNLNAISDSMTPGIWLSELIYDENPVSGVQPAKGKGPKMPGRLIMIGYATGSGEQGAALVGKFIKSLKDNEEFYSDFGEVDLVGVKSEKVDGQDVVSFRVNCIFK